MRGLQHLGRILKQRKKLGQRDGCNTRRQKTELRQNKKTKTKTNETQEDLTNEKLGITLLEDTDDTETQFFDDNPNEKHSSQRKTQSSQINPQVRNIRLKLLIR